MKVLELLNEIEEIIDTASGFPLTGKIMIDAQEILEIVKEIRIELPDEIEQAHWVKSERQRILDDARKEYDKVLMDAKKQAEELIESDDIVVKAKAMSEEIISQAETKVTQLQMGVFDYIDSILYDFQGKMEELNARYFGDMFNDLERTFDAINITLADNRNEIKEMAYKTKMQGE